MNVPLLERLKKRVERKQELNRRIAKIRNEIVNIDREIDFIAMRIREREKS
jgi:hypothetical protein